jgi:hypothetical protein
LERVESTYLNPVSGVERVEGSLDLNPSTLPRPETLECAPPAVCAFCWRAWQANPTPLLYCKHLRTVARNTKAGAWKVLREVTADELRVLGVKA